MGVKVRKRGASAKVAETWSDALIEAARELVHGQSMVVHSPGCPAVRGARCDGCHGEIVGPAIRDRPQ